MKKNYCIIRKNQFYRELYDELIEEELSMQKKDDSNKIHNLIEKKILSCEYIQISNNYDSQEDSFTDLINKITEKIDNENLQGNTSIIYADDNIMYELFYMEDLTKDANISEDELNEFACISNTDQYPIFWSCGILKSEYYDKNIKSSIIKKEDISKLFINNYYHIGIMINVNDKITENMTDDMIEITFMGENPLSIIGNTFVPSDITEILGFSFLPYIEKSDKQNKIATNLLNKYINGKVFLTLLCPLTNIKYWNIYIETINNLFKILLDKDKVNNINQEINNCDKYINPFFLIKKNI